MPITITNLAKHLLLVPLSTSATLYLAPGQSSAALDEVEVNQNAKVDKLVRSGLLRVNRTAAGKAKSPAK